MGVDSPIVERHTSNTPGALWTIGLVFPTESTSPWTFPRRKQREAKRSHVAWFQGNMKATPDRAAIFHNSREGRRWWKESSRVSFLSGPWNFAPSSQALRVPFHSPRDDRYSRLFHGYFLKVVARVSVWQATKKLSRLPRSKPRYSNDLKGGTFCAIFLFFLFFLSFHLHLLLAYSLPSLLRFGSTMDFNSHFIGNLLPDSG